MTDLAAQRPVSWRSLVLALAVTSVSAAVAAYSLIAGPDAGHLSAVFPLLASLICVLCGIRAVHRTRRCMLLLTLVIGTWIWWLGDVSWVLVPLFGNASWWTPTSRVVYLVAGACFCGALADAIKKRAPRSTTRVVADGLLIGVVIALLVWMTVGQDPVRQPMIIDLGVSVVQGTFLATALANALNRSPGLRPACWLLFGNALLLVVIHLKFGRSTLSGTSWEQLVPNLGWGLATLLRAGALWLAPTATVRPADQDEHPGLLERLVPVIAVAAGLISLLLTVQLTGATLALALTVAAALVLWQVLAELERLSLHRAMAASARTLRTQAECDTLTGLYRRDPLFRQIDRALAERRADGGRLGLLFVDLDGFKAINDRFGHAAGDTLLAAVGDLLRSAGRPGDVPCRFGGDEFVVLRPCLVDEADADHWAESIRARMGLSIRVEGIDLQLTASVGLVVSGGDQITADELVGRGDQASYQAKRSGRNQTVRYDDGLGS